MPRNHAHAQCPTCHAGLDTAVHHAECVAPLDQFDGGAA